MSFRKAQEKIIEAKADRIARMNLFSIVSMDLAKGSDQSEETIWDISGSDSEFVGKKQPNFTHK
jgi:hypothetical protein